MNKAVTKVAIATLGCKVNQYDSAAMAETLRVGGYHLMPFTSRADVYLINTCTVTRKTDSQSRQLIRRALRANPLARVIVTGCYAQQSAQQLASLSNKIHILGNPEKINISSYLSQILGRDKPFYKISDAASERNFRALPTTRFLDQTRAYLKIQDGCNSSCAYCIVPEVRGPSRSLPAQEVIKRIKNFVQAGYLEIVITGIHLGAYGWDLTPPLNLLELLKHVVREEGLSRTRFRLSSIEPTEISEDFIRFLSRNQNICPHLHIPLQSGDAAILKKMNRPYTPGFFRDLITGLSSSIKDLQLGIDVIVGFPGESDLHFQNTLQFIRELPVGYLHVFPFSSRSGTHASRLGNHVSEIVKKQRASILSRVALNKRQQFYSSYLNKSLSVLLEGKRDRKTGLLKGFSANYIPVLVKGSDTLMGQEIKVTVTEIKETAVFAAGDT